MEELYIGDLEFYDEVYIGDLEVDIIKLEPETEQIEITPTKEEQIKEGLFNTVIVKGYGNREVRKFNSIEEMNNTVGEEGEFAVVYGKEYEGIYKYENGTWNLISPKDRLEITTNGQYDVSNYAEANVDVKLDIEITDARYLFYQGARTDYMNEILALCKNITNASYMFSQCEIREIDISNIDMSNVIDTSYMFYSSNAIEKIVLENFNTSNATSMQYMFWGCSNLTELDVSNFDTSKATNMSYMFRNCLKLIKLPELNASNVINLNRIFQYCSGLTDFGGLKDVGKAYTQKTANYSNYTQDYSACTKLTYESLLNICRGTYDLNLSYDVANGGTLYAQSIVFGATNKAKLESTEEGLQAIAELVDKGFNVS